MTHNGNLTEKLEIYDRAMIARNNKADIIVSLDLNSASSNSVAGAEVYITANKSLPKYNEEMTVLGNKVLDELSKLGIKNWKGGVATRLIPNDTTDIYTDGTRADYYGIIRYAMRGCKIDYGVISPEGAIPANVQNGEGIKAMIIEHCYIIGTDFQFVDSDDDLQKLAKADANALVDYYKLKLKGAPTPTPTPIPTPTPNNNFKINEDSLIVEPETTLEDIQKKYKDAKLEGELIATGTKIEIEEKQYSIIMLGDVNGDGIVDVIDLTLIKRHLLEIRKITDLYLQAADLDISENNELDIIDLTLLKRHLLGTKIIRV